jgi:hypothetical protein
LNIIVVILSYKVAFFKFACVVVSRETFTLRHYQKI